jgi:hypothetical protein
MAFSHGLSFQFDAVGAVHDTVEDRVGQGVISDEPVPVLDGQLAGKDGGTGAVTVIAVAPKAALLATIYSAIPAVLVSYAWFLLIEGGGQL